MITEKQAMAVFTLRKKGIDFNKDVFALTSSEVSIVREVAKGYKYKAKPNNSSLSNTSRFYVFMQNVHDNMKGKTISEIFK